MTPHQAGGACLHKGGLDVLADTSRHVDRRTEGSVAENSRTLTWLFAASVGIAALVIAAPQLGFASPTGDSVLETIGGVATALATAVVVLRFNARPTHLGLALVVAFAFRAGATLLLATAPTLLGVPAGGALQDATALSTIAGAALLAWAAFAPDTRVRTRFSGAELVIVATAAAVACSAIGVAVHILWPMLDLDRGAFGAAGFSELWRQPVPFMLVESSAAILLAAAAVGFALRVRHAAMHELLMWLAISTTLGAAAQIDYLLTQGQSRATVSLGDLLGSAGMLALAVGAILEYECVRAGERESAVQEERRRLARDLHDGVAQELAFIVGQSRRLALAFPDERALADIGSAAASALDGSRSTIDGLRRPGSHTLGGALAHRARVLADRAGLELDLECNGDVLPSADIEHCLLSILQEAISNAARHAHATKLAVSVTVHGDLILLRISDDGCGFDQERVELSTDRGFGLLGMGERARGLGGALTIESSPGCGTTIDVTVPASSRGRRLLSVAA